MVAEIFHFQTSAMERVGGQVGCGGYVVGNYSDNNATSLPILQAETCQIFSEAEILRWTECGKN